MAPAPELVFLHTAEAHIATFSALMAELGADIPVRHRVDETLLSDAVRAGGVTPALADRLACVIAGTAAGGAALVVCTCSTLGGPAEQAGVGLGIPVLRIDRGLAERAVAAGRRCLVAACLETTLGPTTALLREVAAMRGVAIELRCALFDDAWAKFLSGDRDGYHRMIAAGLVSMRGDAEVVVLAQASMAGAADHCPGFGIPILSSPRIGTEAVILAYRRLISAAHPGPISRDQNGETIS